MKIAVYFSSFHLADASAAEAAQVHEMLRYEGATVSINVTSQLAQRPSRPGMRVNPSGAYCQMLVGHVVP